MLYVSILYCQKGSPVDVELPKRMLTVAHIDAIGRRMGRDVLYVEFHPQTREAQRRYVYQRDAMRADVLAWLDQHAVRWEPCGPIADIMRMDSYRGQVYLDLPFDDADPVYRQVCAYLEHADGSMRHAGVRFMVLSHERALRNAAHDAEGFWEQWSETF